MMRTQSRDTSPEMEQVQIAGLRTFAPAKKFASVRSISASMHFAALQSEVHSGSDYERALAFLERCSPPTIVQAFRAAIPHPAEWVLSLFDVLPPLEFVSSALDQAHVPFALAGSLARAIYGFPRGMRTIEFFVDLDPYQATALVQRIRGEQLVPTSGWSLEEEKSQPLASCSCPAWLVLNSACRASSRLIGWSSLGPIGWRLIRACQMCPSWRLRRVCSRASSTTRQQAPAMTTSITNSSGC